MAVEIGDLYMTPIYVPFDDEAVSKPFGWYVVVYDPANPNERGVTAAYATTLHSIRSDAQEEALNWVKCNKPGRECSVGG